MHDSSFEVEHPILSFLYRLYAAYWIFVFLFLPVFAIVRLKEVYRRRRATKSKYEKKYWANQSRQYWCLLYISVCLYYHMFQDFFIGLFVDSETQAKVTWIFEFATGIPGFIWYLITNKQVAMHGNATDFAVATLIGVIALLIVEVVIDYLNVHGHLSPAGNWIAPEKVTKRENVEFDREEAEYRALSKERQLHKRNQPQNDPDWDSWSRSKRSEAVRKWEAKRDDLAKKIEQCPRASYFDAK